MAAKKAKLTTETKSRAEVKLEAKKALDAKPRK